MADDDVRNDPCLQIQMDLSAMLDGELDQNSVRRVLVHSDACPHCGPFLQGIRQQARAHRELHAVVARPIDPDEPAAVSELRLQLTANRERLARIFYELGRGFVLMGTSPRFSRIVQREPVPIPDMLRRGEMVLEELEEVEQLARGDARRGSWVRARELFAQREVRSPLENLQKGKALLREALALRPEMFEARIYLGHAHHVEDERAAARREFEAVLRSGDPTGQPFAWMHLGNIQIDERDWEGAVESFEAIVASGVVEQHPQFGIVYFNLALCCGHLRRFDECQQWLMRLYSELPHKRRMIAHEFKSRHQFLDLLNDHPHILDSLVDQFPCWFPSPEMTT